MLRPIVYSSDPRVRLYCVPTKVLKTYGSVTNSEALLIQRPSQIPLNIPEDWQSCVLKNTNGEHAAVLVDFGCEFHGSARIYVQYVTSASARANIRVRFGESATEALTPYGERGAGNDHANRDMLMNIGFLSANETNATGYRFLYVELLDDDAEIGLYMLQGVVIQRELERKGSFVCSDNLINDIYETSVYTAFLCSQEYLWDGIKRDRLIWCGDMYPSLLTLTRAYGDISVLRESLDMQKRITPENEWMNGMPSYTMWWILCHDLIYTLSGDIKYLKEQAAYIAAVTRHASEFFDEEGNENLPGAFLDWPNNDNKLAVRAGQQALVKRAFERAAYILGECGLNEDALFCAEKVKLLSKARPNSNGSKQAAALMALWGYADPVQTDRDILTPGGAHGYSTFLGYATLAAKAKAGNIEGALDDMKAYWGKMLELGATTFWEDFNLDWTENAHKLDEIVPIGENDIHASHGAYCYKGLRHSLCHAWASGPAPFLSEYVLGVRPVKPGSAEIEVKPNLGGLSWAEGTYPTPNGSIFVRAEKQPDGTVAVTVDAPDGIKIIK